MIQRIINLPKDHSFFLFGPRGVGKTTLLKETLPPENTYYIDLLDIETEFRYARRPKTFVEELRALPQRIKWVVIDEVQKLPFLLDEVQRFLEDKNNAFYFVLTGSSARKLKRGNANMLAGRAFSLTLAPFTISELNDLFDLDNALSYGTLPKRFSYVTTNDACDYLRSYAHTYLKEEIQSEGIVRKLVGFRNFLQIAAVENGTILSWSNMAREVGIQAKTIQSYYEILEDTLIGFYLPAYRRSIRKRQKTHPKFYFFDTGVKRTLASELTVPLIPGTTDYGRAFEHFFITEIIRMNAYKKNDFSFSYFATHDIEIDLVIERPGKRQLFVEIKSAEFVHDVALRPLQSVVEGVKGSEGICISREGRKRKVGNILVCPWRDALSEIGLG